MPFETVEIMKSLGLARSSLGAPDSILPILSCFCFDDDLLYAYNDITAVIVPAQTGLSCAVDGPTLLGVLGAKSGPFDMKLVDGGKALNLKFGGAKGSSGATLPVWPKDQFHFAYPEEEPRLTMPLSDAFVQAMFQCLISASPDNLVPEFSGVTVHANKTGVFLYSSDNVSASLAVLPAIKGAACSVVFPEQACQQLVKLSAACKTKGAELAIGDTSAVCTFKGATLVTKLLPANVSKYETVFKTHIADIHPTQFPAGLTQELGLAEVLLAKEQVKHCRLTFDGKTVAVAAISSLGSVLAKLPAPGLTGTVMLDPKLLSRVLEYVGTIAVNDRRSLVLQGEGGTFTHLISSAHVPEE